MGLMGTVLLALTIGCLAGFFRRGSEHWAWLALVLLWVGGSLSGLLTSVIASIVLTLACAKVRALRERPPSA